MVKQGRQTIGEVSYDSISSGDLLYKLAVIGDISVINWKKSSQTKPCASYLWPDGKLTGHSPESGSEFKYHLFRCYNGNIIDVRRRLVPVGKKHWLTKKRKVEEVQGIKDLVDFIEEKIGLLACPKKKINEKDYRENPKGDVRKPYVLNYTGYTDRDNCPYIVYLEKIGERKLERRVDEGAEEWSSCGESVSEEQHIVIPTTIRAVV